MPAFKWRQFAGEVILWAVGWYCRYGISYRELEEMLGEPGVTVDHTTIYRWVHRIRFAPLRHGSQFMNSIARPEFHIERRLAPRPAVPAAELPFQRHEARVAGSPLQEDHIWNDSLVTTRVTARAHLGSFEEMDSTLDQPAAAARPVAQTVGN